MKDSFQNHVDGLFRNMLQFYKKEPEKHVWENIEKKLDQEEKAALVNKSKAGFIKAATLILLFIFLGSTILYYHIYLVQPGQSIISSDISKSGAGNKIPKLAKTFRVTPVLIESKSNTAIFKSGRPDRTEISAPDFPFSNVA